MSVQGIRLSRFQTRTSARCALTRRRGYMSLSCEIAALPLTAPASSFGAAVPSRRALQILSHERACCV